MPTKLWNKPKAAAPSGCGSTDHGIPSSWAIAMPVQLHCPASEAKIKHIFLICCLQCECLAMQKGKIRGFGKSSERKLMNCEQVVFDPKGCDEKLLYFLTSLGEPWTPCGKSLQHSVVTPEWSPGWTTGPEFGEENIPDSTSRVEECDDTCPRLLVVGHIFYFSSSFCLLSFVEMQLKFVSHPIFRNRKLRYVWNVDLLSRDSDVELKISNFCALCDWKHWKKIKEPKAFKELRFWDLHISAVYLKLESHVEFKRLHCDICCCVVQVHTVLAHPCQPLGNWGKEIRYGKLSLII